jgi:hypothetical protein
MAFQPLSTSNTFTHWITETQRSVSVLNQITDGGGGFTYYSNTNISVGDDLLVGGNLTVRGFLVLDDIGYNDLNIAGNVEVVGTVDSDLAVFTNLSILNNTFSLNTTTLNIGTEANLNTLSVFDTLIASNIEITGDITGTSNLFVPNLVVDGNVEILNVTSDLFVGAEANLNTLSVFDTLITGNIEITGDVTGAPNLFVSNLVVTENVDTLNVTSELFVGSDAVVNGNLLSFLCCQNGLTLSGDLTLNLAIIDTATVTTLIGEANTNIYNNIFASNAYTSVQKTLAEFASLSCILG